jgi:hypothetical protein
VEVVKVHDYCLNPNHPRGRHKARVFAAVLGLTAADTDLVRQALLEAVVREEASLGTADAYGQRYVVDFTMQGPSGTGVVRSSWIVRTGEDFPRLTSCYVL